MEKAVAPQKPFFAYYATGTAHVPHHAPKEWIANMKGKFDQGRDKVCEETLQRQKKLGVVPPDAQLTARPKELPAWDSVAAGGFGQGPALVRIIPFPVHRRTRKAPHLHLRRRPADGGFVGFCLRRFRPLVAGRGRPLHRLPGRQGAGESGFTPLGAARGVGQHSIWAFAAGAQYRLTDALWLRLGYTFSQNPIDALHVSANVASPNIVQHTLSVGASYQVSECLSLDVAYVHGFQNSATGPLVTPLGVVPGTAITSVVSADTFVAGATLRFGTCD
jgi:hypothetical protein